LEEIEMSESKHTPGPWTVKTDGKGFFWVDHDYEESGGESVCNTGTHETAEANANLIAAAPLLLEALKEAASMLPSNVHPQLREKFNRVIAKAEGSDQ
jgi:hypothetical protein